MSSDPRPSRDLGEIARAFLKLGVVAFGGPAAHIAMMEDEFVGRRGWISRQHFVDLVGATNLIPGPNSTEMTMHVGYERAGWRGLVIAGTCFICPAVLVTGVLAWLYVSFGTLPSVEPFLYGIKPAVIAVILGAVWRLGRQAVRGWRLAMIGMAVLAAVLAGVGEVSALLIGALSGALLLRGSGYDSSRTAAAFVPILFEGASRVATETAGATVRVEAAAVAEGTATAVAAGLATSAGAATAASAATAAALAAGISLWKLFFFFLKIGAILYGSGYVLVAFLEGGLVVDYAWLNQGQLLDAIAIGQLTPGPVLSTSTFIGYIIRGVPGALAATAGMFLPSFILVLILNPLIPKMRTSVWLSAFLDAVNVAAVALMLGVTIELGVSTLRSWPAWVIGVAAAALVLRFKVTAPWLVLGGAVVGWVLRDWAAL